MSPSYAHKSNGQWQLWFQYIRCVSFGQSFYNWIEQLLSDSTLSVGTYSISTKRLSEKPSDDFITKF